MRTTRRRYSFTEKREAVKLLAEVGQTEASRRLGVSRHTLTDWAAQARVGLYPFIGCHSIPSSGPSELAIARATIDLYHHALLVLLEENTRLKAAT